MYEQFHQKNNSAGYYLVKTPIIFNIPPTIFQCYIYHEGWAVWDSQLNAHIHLSPGESTYGREIGALTSASICLKIDIQNRSAELQLPISLYWMEKESQENDSGINKHMAEKLKKKNNQETDVSFNMSSASGFWESSVIYYNDAFCLLPQLEYLSMSRVNANTILNPNEHCSI